jgi:hypothetical protein
VPWQIEVMIEACTSLILVLRRCAEQIRMNFLSPADVDPCLKAALQVGPPTWTSIPFK